MIRKYDKSRGNYIANPWKRLWYKYCLARRDITTDPNAQGRWNFLSLAFDAETARTLIMRKGGWREVAKIAWAH